MVIKRMEVYDKMISITYAKDVKMIKKFMNDKYKREFTILLDINELFGNLFTNSVSWYPHIRLNMITSYYSKPEIMMIYINKSNIHYRPRHLKDIKTILKKIPYISLYTNTTNFRNNVYHILKDKESDEHDLPKKIQKITILKSKDPFHHIHQ